MKLFELFATLSLDTSDFDRDVAEATQDGQKLSSVLSTAVAKGTVMGNTLTSIGRGLVSFGQSVLGFGADLVQTAATVQAEKAAFESTFGELQGIALEAFNRVGEATNIYSTRLMNAGTKAYSQFTAAGMDSATALIAMESYLGYAADAAAYYNISLEDADYAMRSFLRGNVEAGESIGLFTTETQRNAKAMDLYNKSWKDLTEAEREYVMLDIVGETYGRNGALGQATREATSYENVLGNINEIWRQIKATLGGPILEALLPVMQEFSQFLQDNPEMVQSLAESIGYIADATFDGIMQLMKFVADNGDAIATFFERMAAAISALLSGDFFKFLSILDGSYYTISGSEDAVRNAYKQGGDNATYTDVYGGADGYEASGLGYVPYDNFHARLHRGETVVTAAENNARRSGKRARNTTEDMAAAIAAALNGTTVQMDGHAVGVLVTGTVSREIAREAKRRG